MSTVDEIIKELQRLRGEFEAMQHDSAATVIRIVSTNPQIANILALGQSAGGLIERVAALERRSGTEGRHERNFRTREAFALKPSEWKGDKHSEPFNTLSMELRVWAGALHDDLNTLIDLAEREERYLTKEIAEEHDLHDDPAIGEDFDQLDRHLWQILMATAKGHAKGFVDNPERSGFKAWKQMVQHFDPRTGADRSVAYGRVTQPLTTTGKPKNMDAARVAMQVWERELAAFELKYSRKVDEDAKILALKSLMPDTMFGDGGAFRGRAFTQYDVLRKTVIDYLDDKSISAAGQKPAPWT